MDAAPLVTICIVTGRRIPLLDACLASLQQQVDAPPFELLVCSDGDPDVAQAVRSRFPDARIRVVSGAYPGAARNVLIDDARGELLLFLDDDVTVRPDLLARLADLARTHPDFDVFGGPNDSPEHSTRFQFVQGAAMASIAGAGPVRRRYGAHPAGPADERYFILCNLAVRRRAMLPFDPDLVCAEENALLSEMSRRGIAMYYDPELAVFHERRDTFAGFGRQMYKYGRGRGQLMVRTPTTASAAYLVPSALVAYGALLPLAAAVTRGRVRAGMLAPLAAYAAVVGAGATAIAATLRKPTTLPLAAALIVELHVCYGAGVLRGLTERTRRRAAPVVSAWMDDALPEPAAVLVEPA
jgi:glycosyltransferase involved in cell wall biosynthesis